MASKKRMERAIIRYLKRIDDWEKGDGPCPVCGTQYLRLLRESVKRDDKNPSQEGNGLLFGAKNIAEENARLLEWDLQRSAGKDAGKGEG